MHLFLSYYGSEILMEFYACTPLCKGAGKIYFSCLGFVENMS